MSLSSIVWVPYNLGYMYIRLSSVLVFVPVPNTIGSHFGEKKFRNIGILFDLEVGHIYKSYSRLCCVVCEYIYYARRGQYKYSNNIYRC